MLSMQRAHRSNRLVLLAVALSTLALIGLSVPLVSAFQQREVAVQGLIAEVQTLTQSAVQSPPPTATDTPFVQDTLPPTWTATDTLTASATATASLTFMATNTNTPTPTPTATASQTFTPSPAPTITLTFTPSPIYSPTPTFVPPKGAPAPVAAISEGAYDIFNILLIGSDLRPTDGSYRTDTLIVVSINRTTHTLALLSIPRDLYVYIPWYGYDRINTASERGDWLGWPGGGANLLLATIRYNLGLTIQAYARVTFEGFKKIVDTVGGVDVAVDCPLSDYHLSAPGLQEGIESNYSWYTLPIGVHHMDGADALWYARSRETTSDFDRGRRQQEVLRAIWHQALNKHLIANLPDLWSQLTQVVDTNLTLGDVLALLPLTADLDSTRLRSYAIGPAHTTPWNTEAGDEVLLPQAAPIRSLLTTFYTPPTQKHLFTEQPSIELVNGTMHAEWLALASARLAWEGFQPQVDDSADPLSAPHTLLYDYTGSAKPDSLAALISIFQLRKAAVISAPDPNRTTDFRVVLGSDYESCTFDPWQSAPLTR